MATARIGVILVNINPANRTKKLAYTMRRSEVQGLFLIPSFKTSDYVEMLAELMPKIDGPS
jgi:fatty-acyl-CoA synthase